MTADNDVDPGAGEFIFTPPVAAYYEIRFPLGERAFFVPSLRAYKASLGISGGWSHVDDEAMAELATAVGKVESWPPPALAEVLVGGMPARDPEPYLRLYDDFAVVAPPAEQGRALWIVLRSERASPWSVSIPLPFPKRSGVWVNGFNLLEYLPEHRVLNRNGEYVRLPPELADLIEADAEASKRSNGFDYWWFVVAGALVCLIALAFAGRRKLSR